MRLPLTLTLSIALAALVQFAGAAAKADILTLEIESLIEAEAQILCGYAAAAEGGQPVGRVRNIDYFLWACRIDVPARRDMGVDVMPLLHAAQAGPVCRAAANARGGRWTGNWEGNGPLAPGVCTISVPTP